MMDIEKIRLDFPILGREVYGRPLVYMDNGATTQKPRRVVEAMVEEYYNVNANVHRGVHFLSQKATDLHEEARETVRRFIGAGRSEEIVFTRGTTESMNLLATSFARYCGASPSDEVKKEVIVSVMEHHSNIVPWQLNGFKVVPFVSADEIEGLINERTVMVSVTHVSNVLGVENPVGDIVKLAHGKGLPVVIDGAQSVPHRRIDVGELDCDFLAFSGHKVYGPTGIGVLYGRKDWLDKLPPYQGGGEMIDHVSFEKTTFNQLPYKFEAGTPDYIGSHALAAALDYVSDIGMDEIERYEAELGQYMAERLREIEGLKIYGEPKGAVVSFNIYKEGVLIHHLDVGTLLDRLGIAVRTGHHCAEPLMRHLGIEGTVRASLSFYNTKAEVDRLIEGLKRVVSMF